jgi:DNA-binding NarL/FixJ family response regulator
MGARIRILLASQVRLVCQLLAAVLQSEADMEVAGCATSVDEVLVRVKKADVVLVHARLGSGEALAIVRAVTSHQLPVKVLTLDLAEPEGQILECIQAGTSGYVLGDDSIDDLLERIRNAYSDQVRVSPSQAIYES